MPNFSQMSAVLREQMNTTVSRSDVLKPLAWLVGILFSATVMLSYVKGPPVAIYICLAAACGSGLLYGFAYVYCLFKDRDALRSEKYSLNKMAIERGYYGDSISGVIDGSATYVDDDTKTTKPQMIEQDK